MVSSLPRTREGNISGDSDDSLHRNREGNISGGSVEKDGCINNEFLHSHLPFQSLEEHSVSTQNPVININLDFFIRVF